MPPSHPSRVAAVTSTSLLDSLNRGGEGTLRTTLPLRAVQKRSFGCPEGLQLKVYQGWPLRERDRFHHTPPLLARASATLFCWSHCRITYCPLLVYAMSCHLLAM